MHLHKRLFFCTAILTTEAEASLVPPYNMPANTPTIVAGPQLTVPANFEFLCITMKMIKKMIKYGATD